MKAVNRKNKPTGRYAIRHGEFSFLGRSYVSPGLLDRLRGKTIDIYYDRRDISVIYLFLDGELVGEAYCTEFLGRRTSIWEAQAQRRSDAKHAEEASRISRENRQQIQQEATSGRKLLSLETRRLERQRHFDQHRQDIHPEHTQAVLQVLAQQLQSPSPKPPPKPSGLLPPAIPQDDPPGTKVTHLTVRSREVRHD